MLFVLLFSPQGTEDTTVPYKYAPLIMSTLPKSAKTKLVTIEGGTHDLVLTEPDRVLKAMEEWVL
jgi:pimeloyl-ACP methyl ester carboxylesterase